eukprot:Pompholyxophrys_punicea_v1_NODE_386_length_2080_cov_2.678519.p3 type:complete len:127 gc:universal NODE_386_length_2080_cov_2.678519:994-614(-)
MNLWNSIFSHSLKAKKVWSTKAGETKKSHSATRWWSFWEVAEQLCRHWTHMLDFLNEENLDEKFPPELKKKAQNFLRANESEIALELAIFIDIGEILVKCTYLLEGDYCLVFHAYDILAEANESFD